MQCKIKHVLLKDAGNDPDRSRQRLIRLPNVVHIATISPVGAIITLWPIKSQPSSLPALATPTTQLPF